MYLQVAFQTRISILAILIFEFPVLFGINKYSQKCERPFEKAGNCEYRITMRMGECTKQGVGFLDTGNHLKEPISGKCVSVVSYAFFRPFMRPNEDVWKKILLSDKPELFGELPLRYIPYHSIGKNSYLYGIQVDEIIIHNKDQDKNIKNAWVAVSVEPLTCQSNYDIILHPMIF